MTPESFIAAKAAQAISALYGAEVEASALQVSVTRKEFEGDFTLVVFPLLRISHSTPENTGNAIGAWLKDNVPEISDYNCVKGFLNILLSNLFWNGLFKAIVTDPDFGSLPSTGRNIMVEFSSPNTNKPLHLGHIRNNLLGDSVSRLLKAAGNNVIRTTLVNDRGIHICKSMLAWQKVGGGATPQSSGIKGDHLVGDMYVAFNDIYKKEVEDLVAGGMSEEEAKKAEASAKALFAGGGVSENMPTTEITEADLTDGVMDIMTILVKTGLCSSKSDARRNVQQGGVTVDDEKITDISKTYTADELKAGIVVKRGKKNFNKLSLK